VYSKEKNDVNQQCEAMDASRRIGGYFDGVFIRGSRSDKYQPRGGVEFLRCSAI
jgi:hypothetical protein